MNPRQRPRRRGYGLLMAGGQVRYQLTLVSRSPIATFTVLVIPLMLLVVLDLVSPEASALDGTSYTAFLAPAMATFALINACYVNVLTSLVIAREEGVLKRLRGTPLPLWAYLVGRMAAAFVVAAMSIAVVVAVAGLFLDVRLDAARIGNLAGVAALGGACFTALGFAVSSFVPRPDIALTVAYGTFLPIAFVSDVFFPSTTSPQWLHDVAAAFPVAPIAKAAEQGFLAGGGWPMTTGQLGVVLGWTAGALAFAALTFRWEPGASALSALTARTG